MEYTLIFLFAVYLAFHKQINSWFRAPSQQPSQEAKASPSPKPKSLNIKWVLIGTGIFIYLLLLIIEKSGSTSRQPAIPALQAVVQRPTGSDSESNTEPDITLSPSPVILNRYSTGYDWKKADYQTKRQFCQTVAAAESKEFNHDFTADFYMNALDGFYDNSSDPNILGENINRVVGMTTAVAIS